MAFCFIFLLFLLPSPSSMSYRHYNLLELCPSEISNVYVDSVVNHNEGTTTIDIHDNPTISSGLLEHVWDNSSYKHIHHCEFNVKTGSKLIYGASSGLFVAIRELRFRQNIIGECIDYVIFELNSIATPTSHKVCGAIFGDEAVQDIKNYFEIPDGFVKIIIHIGYHNLEPNQITMKLTFTAFEDCNGEYQFRCSDGMCISRSLYDDSIINCIPPYCADEPRYHGKCGISFLKPGPVTVAIISSLVFVASGVAIAWHFFKIFVSCSRYFVHRETIEPIVEYQSVYVPPETDNTLGAAQSSTTDDPPPSYESLFQ